MKGRGLLFFGMLACIALSFATAGAQPSSSDKALAIQLFDDAEKLMAAGNAPAACPKYSESQRRDPQLGTLLHLADCQEKVGKTASAWAGFKEAAEIAARRNAAGLNEPREPIARARAADLESKLARLTIVVTQTDVPNLEIRQDGELLGRAAWGSAMPVDPGTYTFSAQARGKKAWSKVVEIPSNGAKIELKIPPLEDEGAPSPAVPTAATAGSGVTTGVAAQPAIPERSTKGSTQRLIGYLVGGTGVISAGVGAAFGLIVKGQEAERDAICPSGEHCTPDDGRSIQEIEAKARSNAVACNIGFAVGGAALLGGLALVLTAPSETSGSSAAAPTLRIGTWGGPNSAGAMLHGRW